MVIVASPSGGDRRIALDENMGYRRDTCHEVGKYLAHSHEGPATVLMEPGIPRTWQEPPQLHVPTNPIIWWKAAGAAWAVHLEACGHFDIDL